MAPWVEGKSQAPNPNEIRKPKSEARLPAVGIWSFIGIWGLGFHWDLGLGISPPPSVFSQSRHRFDRSPRISPHRPIHRIPLHRSPSRLADQSANIFNMKFLMHAF